MDTRARRRELCVVRLHTFNLVESTRSTYQRMNHPFNDFPQRLHRS